MRGIARDGEAEMFFRVEQGEALEGFVEKRADAGVLPRARGPACELLLLAPLLERGARGVDLLGDDGLVVELDAGPLTAIGARPVVERARPGLDDEPQEGAQRDHDRLGEVLELDVGMLFAQLQDVAAEGIAVVGPLGPLRDTARVGLVAEPDHGRAAPGLVHHASSSSPSRMV